MLQCSQMSFYIGNAFDISLLLPFQEVERRLFVRGRFILTIHFKWFAIVFSSVQLPYISLRSRLIVVVS